MEEDSLSSDSSPSAVPPLNIESKGRRCRLRAKLYPEYIVRPGLKSERTISASADSLTGLTGILVPVGVFLCFGPSFPRYSLERIAGMSGQVPPNDISHSHI